MNRTDPEIDRNRERMIEAEVLKDSSRTNDDWEVWQRAATDYWTLLHPNLDRFRRGDPARTPTVDEMRERAEIVAHATDGIPTTWRLEPPSTERAENLARVGWFHEQLAGLYGPVGHAIDRLRRDDRSGVETLVRFLEADVYCFRSGYLKADVIRFLTRTDLDDATIERLRRVVVAVVEGADRREFGAYVRLARRVDTLAFRDELRSMLDSPSSRAARHARWVLIGLGEPPSSGVTSR